MAKFRGEVPFDGAGKGAFFLFTLSEGIELEESIGVDLIEKASIAAQEVRLGVLAELVRVGLKKRDPEGKLIRIVDSIDDLPFHIKDAIPAVLDAVSLLVANETYEDLLKKVAEAKKKVVEDTAKELKEAADKAGVPFTEAALVSAILGLDGDLA